MIGTLVFLMVLVLALALLVAVLRSAYRGPGSHPLDGESACEKCGHPVSVFPRTAREAHGICAYCGGFGYPVPRNPSPPFPPHVQEALDEALEEAAREALEESVARTPAHGEGEA